MFFLFTAILLFVVQFIFLTGKNVNEAKKKVTDEEVNKLLKDAQKQLKKDINVELTSEERAEKEKLLNKHKDYIKKSCEEFSSQLFSC